MKRFHNVYRAVFSQAMKKKINVDVIMLKFLHEGLNLIITGCILSMITLINRDFLVLACK